MDFTTLKVRSFHERAVKYGAYLGYDFRDMLVMEGFNGGIRGEPYSYTWSLNVSFFMFTFFTRNTIALYAKEALWLNW